MAHCPFCGRDPYHYVDNGVGMEPVAVVCCDLGIAVYGPATDDTEITTTIGKLRTLALLIRIPDDETELTT